MSTLNSVFSGGSSSSLKGQFFLEKPSWLRTRLVHRAIAICSRVQLAGRYTRYIVCILVHIPIAIYAYRTGLLCMAMGRRRLAIASLSVETCQSQLALRPYPHILYSTMYVYTRRDALENKFGRHSYKADTICYYYQYTCCAFWAAAKESRSICTACTSSMEKK